MCGVRYAPRFFWRSPRGGCRLNAARGEKFGEHARRVRPRFVPDDGRRRALRDHASAAVAAFGAEVDDPVGVAHDVEVVLDHDDRVAGVDESVQHMYELLDVGHVQADGGFVQYAGRNIAQVLDMSVEEALEFFSAHRKIRRALQALHDTGLDYLKLGQTSPTLSGGEAQRVKLVTHLLAGLKEPDLLERHPKRNLFILEEPTIGLHIADVRRLVEVLQRLVDAGHSVIVIEHNLDLIAEADWIIDLGPEGGDGGGQIVCEGTPELVARCKHSHTGRFLKAML
jgi:ABC-type Mn2+/Zn2+ transport system ATPase subunit